MAGTKRYKTVKEIEEAIESFFSDKIRLAKPFTIQGLALALGFNSRQSLLNYEGYTDEKDKPFLDTIKRAKLRIEENKVEGMILGEYNTTAIIFDLKNNHGHKDKTEVDLKVDKESLTDKELEEKIAEFEKRNK